MNLEVREAAVREVVKLTEESSALMRSLYPEESNHFTDPGELGGDGNLLLGAFMGDVAVGCVGYLRTGPGEAEIKRLFVSPDYRGRGIATALMRLVEARALSDGIRVIRLETGAKQPEPIGLYERLGYCQRGPFGHYREDPLSVFFEKTLDSVPATG